MNATLDLTLNTTVDISASPQSGWPLPATKVPNAHLTWTEWLALQADRAIAQQPEQAAYERQRPDADEIGMDETPVVRKRLGIPA